MVRAIWLAGAIAALAQAQAHEMSRATVSSDESPQIIDNFGTTAPELPDTQLETSPLANDTRTLWNIGSRAASEIYEYIAQKIKPKSDQHSCTLIYGTDSNDGLFEDYAFQATVTGANCNTTALYEAILKAVESCADKLYVGHAVRGCCRFSHGGTWTGHLRLTSDPEKFPAATVDC